jgi:hypothetical protein
MPQTIESMQRPLRDYYPKPREATNDELFERFRNLNEQSEPVQRYQPPNEEMA